MPEILEPGLFTQLFTSMVEEGAAETASMMNALADQSVARARELLLTYRADVLGPSTSPRGEPPAFRSGNLRAAIGHEEPKPGDYGTYSVLIGPRPVPVEDVTDQVANGGYLGYTSLQDVLDSAGGFVANRLNRRKLGF